MSLVLDSPVGQFALGANMPKRGEIICDFLTFLWLFTKLYKVSLCDLQLVFKKKKNSQKMLATIYLRLGNQHVGQHFNQHFSFRMLVTGQYFGYPTYWLSNILVKNVSQHVGRFAPHFRVLINRILLLFFLPRFMSRTLRVLKVNVQVNLGTFKRHRP